MSLLTINKLSIHVSGKEAPLVTGSSFSIEAGKTVAIVGESGSGKSLTALSIMKLLGKEFSIGGEMVFDGKNLAEQDMHTLRGNEISMIFQEPMTALNPLHTIEKQIGEVLDIHQQITHAQRQEKIIALLDQVGLPHFKDRLNTYPHQLSGGERQRVMIAMAIANKPQLLIADEPTTALDVHVEKKILELLANLQKEMNMAMLFITHDLPMVKRIADHVIVMKDGVIVEQGNTKNLFGAPQHEYTKNLLSSLPSGTPVELSQHAETLLHTESISVRFPIKKGVFARTVDYKKAVEEASFNVKRGETLGIVGESGSGKTTLAMALLRMVKCEGKAVFLDSELTSLKGAALRQMRSNMQLVFQDPFSSLNPRMSIGQIMAEGLKVHQPTLTKSERDALSAETLKQVGLDAEMLDRYPHEFSGGQRQRIAIARAIILEPQLIILDEPTSALDVTVQMQILDLLKSLQQKRQLSYLFITHDLRVIRTIAHRLIVLKSGRLIEQGLTTTILHNPSEPYTKALIEAAYT